MALSGGVVDAVTSRSSTGDAVGGQGVEVRRRPTGMRLRRDSSPRVIVEEANSVVTSELSV